MTSGGSDRDGASGASRGLRVLVAEDNDVSRALAVRLLTKRGHDAVSVTTGRDAVDAWAAGGFDLILMDLQMPLMDGYAATAAIRERERGGARRTPIIALTASSGSAEEERCRAVGMDAFLSKPVRIDAFYEVIANVLDRKEQATPASAAPAQEDAGQFDIARALEAVDGERELLKGMIAIFMRQTPRVMQDIDQAIAAGDASALEIAAHKLKGSVAMFGAHAAREWAQKLEDIANAGELRDAAAARARLGEHIEKLRIALEAAAEGDAE